MPNSLEQSPCSVKILQLYILPRQFIKVCDIYISNATKNSGDIFPVKILPYHCV